jgi:hypothetical protein
MNNILNLPTGAKVLLLILVVCAALAPVIVVMGLTAQTLWVVGLGVGMVLLLLGLFFLCLKWRHARQSKQMEVALKTHNFAKPAGLSDPALLAGLDNLRKTFEGGLQKFRAAGKDLYSMPWFIVAGEPGSGKTEAIRHSNVGFPAGLQDEFQGQGGTINMHWWFTNQAVFLDTAGRIFFEGIQPGTTNEWKEFLRLLGRSRPHCPINGFVLVVPADCLIRDSAEKIEEKAKRTAIQLDNIQRLLDIRFPVFVVITKCDLVAGFREYFDSLDDPQLQHQIMGWSNPDALDAPFQPDLLDRNLKTGIEQLKQRRLGLLLDPTPKTSGGNRLNEVDGLYAFPHNLALLFPRLRRYMELLFVPNPFSSKPLFLRGVYFTCAMREGAALDEELAAALNTPLDKLPEGRIWEKEKSYFLRDLCVEKIFKEKNLVTRASNTRRMMTRRKMLLFGTAIVGLAVVAFLGWFGGQSLQSSVGRQRDYWDTAAKGWPDEDPGYWTPRVESNGSSGQDSKVVKFQGSGDSPTLADFHQQLFNFSREELRVPWLFRWLPGSQTLSDKDRAQAQRDVFDASVVRPLVFFARDKLVKIQAKDWTPAATNALCALLELEAQSAGATKADSTAAASFADAGNLNALMVFLTGEKLGKPYQDIFKGVYSGDVRPAVFWAPSWLSAGATLGDNKPIGKGLDAYGEYVKNNNDGLLANVQQLDLLLKSYNLVGADEQALWDAATSPDHARPAWSKLGEDARLATADSKDAASQLAPGTWFQLTTLYKQRLDDVQNTLKSYDSNFKDVLESRDNQSVPIIGEANKKIQATLAGIQKTITDQFPESKQADLQQVDDNFLRKAPQANVSVLQGRMALYDLCMTWAEAKLPEPNTAPFTNLIGHLKTQTDQVQQDYKTQADQTQQDYKNNLDQVNAYEGPFREKAATACQAMLGYVRDHRLAELGRARDQRLDALHVAYLAEAQKEIKKYAIFPLVFDATENSTTSIFSTLRERLKVLQGDVTDAALAQWPDLAKLRGQTQMLLNMVPKFILDNGTAALSVEIHVPTATVEADLGASYDLLTWIRVRNGQPIRIRNLSSDTDAGTLPMDAPSSNLQFDFFRTDNDATNKTNPISYLKDNLNLKPGQTWLPLRLVTQSSGLAKPDSAADRKSWSVRLDILEPVSHTSETYYVRLVFKQPIPDPAMQDKSNDKYWPRLADFQ